MVIRSKYTGKCKNCGCEINVGDEINWEPGMGSSHVKCPANGKPVEYKPKTMRSQYKSTCTKCGKNINVGDVINWSREKGASHVECPAKVEGEIVWTKGEGYGGEQIDNGAVVKREERYYVVTNCTSKYYREDGMSFGVGDESGRVYTYTARPATDEEAAPRIERERVANEKHAAKATLEEIEHNTVWETPETATIDGEHLMEFNRDSKLYGGGIDWFVDAEYVWVVRGNGADGDDWSRNNCGGSIARRTPRTDELVSTLRQIAATLLKGGN